MSSRNLSTEEGLKKQQKNRRELAWWTAAKRHVVPLINTGINEKTEFRVEPIFFSSSLSCLKSDRLRNTAVTL